MKLLVIKGKLYDMESYFDAERKVARWSPAQIMWMLLPLMVYAFAGVMLFTGLHVANHKLFGLVVGGGFICLFHVMRTLHDVILDNRRLRTLYYMHTGEMP